jgi:hypothetical protein
VAIPSLATIMTINKVLFAGCSFTADCGFTAENIAKYHWPVLLGKHYNLNFDNLAIGGLSNDEIFFRSLETASQNNYRLVVIMWSEIDRKSIYYADNNVDDFTIINNGEPCGLNYTEAEVRTYSKLHYTYFNNHYIALKRWLLKIIALQNIFAHNNQPFLFIKGFENYLLDFSKVKYIDNAFLMMSDDIKKMLDFDNRPDYYILEKIDIIKRLIQQINKSKWLNFHQASFFDMCIDSADDQKHPGLQTNQLLVDNLIEYIDNNNLLNSKLT